MAGGVDGGWGRVQVLAFFLSIPFTVFNTSSHMDTNGIFEGLSVPVLPFFVFFFFGGGGGSSFLKNPDGLALRFCKNCIRYIYTYFLLFKYKKISNKISQ